MTWITGAQNTWCPGCGNFAVQHALKDVFAGLVADEDQRPEEFVLVSGIGCHAKIADYLAVNSFYAIHGRTLPVAAGIKLADPSLTVVACAGDGDAYAEGLGHLVFAAKRNTDITAVVHDNRVYGLTTGQYTPTSYTGFKGRSTPAGVKERPFNPVELALASGATFVARVYTRRLDHLREVLRRAVLHRGFSFVEVLQVCATYNNLTAAYNNQVYELEGHDTTDLTAALERAREWDYSDGAPIALGVFYEIEREREAWPPMGRLPDHRRREVIREVLEGRR
ncbi:2-oxoacid:ferredoxin oxidoreductase subunit beta [Methanofollis formosanus]|uniref:2-oxoacid:ferredoxin oxidoreductase subunit beta n=1 Tax=Methanofollis formosanus TaxID=299308 RepID=A0A8G1A0F7_9EURY|nr:thiamine pyrophosphate-dependent enzyme [Methanofollis formosanus]QYZ78770.1 2-oxoacid:ferredoxin oxidoreductase subunit beta [Methanofollis formosanus]